MLLDELSKFDINKCKQLISNSLGATLERNPETSWAILDDFGSVQFRCSSQQDAEEKLIKCSNIHKAYIVNIMPVSVYKEIVYQNVKDDIKIKQNKLLKVKSNSTKIIEFINDELLSDIIEDLYRFLDLEDEN